MPHHINEADGALVIEFGYGDLSIGAAGDASGRTDELVIWPHSPRPIGNINHEDKGKNTAEVKAIVRMVFHDPCSLDVLIHQATHLRDLMNGPQKWTAVVDDDVICGEGGNEGIAREGWGE